MTSIREMFADRRERLLLPLAGRLETHLSGIFHCYPRIDRISVRVKSVERFVAKAEKREGDTAKYDDPLNQIQDQIGARIVTFYKSDADRLSEDVKKYFRHIEARQVLPDSESEFGYEGIHFILFIPEDVFDESSGENKSVDFFELQIKTLFQHAWSEAEHDLGYKPSTRLSRDQKRRLAFTAAQAWGADRVFNELYEETLATFGP